MRKQVEQSSLWALLGEIAENLKHKRLADVFRLVSFQPSETFGPHQHLRIEINYVKKGRCILHMNNESVRFVENEMMIICSNVEHVFEAGPEGATLMQLEFLPEVFSCFTPKGNSELTPEVLFSEENRLIKIVNNVRIMRAVQRVVNELHDKNKYHQYLVVMYYAELLILIYRHIDEAYLPICTSEPLKRAVSYMRLNYQSDITIAEVAQHAGIGGRYIRKLFAQYLNLSPQDFLSEVRVNKSMELLRNTEMSVKEICFACGFKSPQYYSKVFKQQTGLSPKEVSR